MSDRAEYVLTKTPHGLVVEEAVDGRKWIFVGWSSNASGYEMNFIRQMRPSDHNRIPFHYHASMADTLVRKFPGLQQYRKTEQ